MVSNRECAHVKAWAACINLQLNLSKTRELIVGKRRLGSYADPVPILQWSIRVTSMRVFSVVVSANITIGSYLDEILSSSASSIHALRMLRSHGLGCPSVIQSDPLDQLGIHVMPPRPGGT